MGREEGNFLLAIALIKPGSNPARILDCLKDNMFQLVISESIIGEIKRILLYPKLKEALRQCPQVGDFAWEY